MRSIRTVIVGLLVALLSVSAVSANALQAEQALPKRTITEVPPDENQITFNTFKLNGVVTELQLDGVTSVPYANKTVQVQKKACAKGCKWKTVKKIKTDENGKYRGKIYAPQNGLWKWRVKVKASNGYGTTKGQSWTTGFQ